MICKNDVKPNFKKAMDEANMLLVSSGTVSSFPFSIKKLIKEKTDIVIRNYDKAASYGFNVADFGSEDATIINGNDRFIVFYNQDVCNQSRKVFSITHELGHYKLGHDLTDHKNYDRYEIETNFFSAQLLMPEQIINELIRRGKKITEKNLMKWFGVSFTAAQKRIETLRKIDFRLRSMEEKGLDDLILFKYKDFIDSIAPINLKYFDPYEEEELQNERDSWL